MRLLPVNKSKKVFDELNFYTGMNEEEINNDLKDKEEILAWMIKNKIKDVDDVGRIVSMYYEDPDFVLNFVRKEGKPEKILED
ncbi:MAG: hypothetical protein A7316_11190 [Candidatus Altiarchaeales archaeon WOR_SM1_86-2]|nr:MAG: hypothetical protein A7316_11190 [Candidatus Altiarchaeales archaeon WOR_SM1_86-2]